MGEFILQKYCAEVFKLHKQHITCQSEQVEAALAITPPTQLVLNDCALSFANLRPLFSALGK
jgi:hypothetical protein